jgi:hypothetical protein
VNVDNLTVPRDASCTLDGTHVNGSITVEREATLNASSVQVNGSILADRADRVTVSAGSSVKGKIEILNSGSAIIRAVDIDGDLTLEENDFYLNAEDNTIGGNLQAFRNSSWLFITGNNIGGNLQCRDNFPRPFGSGNIVSGNLEGQCEDLGENPAPPPTPTPAPPTQTPPPPTGTPTATPPSATQTALAANDDAYSLTGAQILVPAPGILANDLAPGPVEVDLITQPQNGSLSLGPQGGFEYQAQDGFFGTDSFTYRLRSGGSVSNTATVQLTIADQEAPTVSWTAPVLAGQRYDLGDGDQVFLEVEASDNNRLSQVTFIWWDAVNQQHVTLGNETQPPFRIQVSADALNPAWNQVFVVATDLAGNSSDQPFIWLYKLGQGQGGGPILYLPLIRKINE